MEEIAELRERMKSVAGEARNKDELYKQLVSYLLIAVNDIVLE